MITYRLEKKQKKLDVKIVRLRGLNAQQSEKVMQAAQLLRKILNTDTFENRVVTHEYWKGLSAVSGFKGTDLSGRELYDKIMSGEDLYGGADGSIEIDLTGYWGRRFSKVIGYTYFKTIRTWVNKRFLKKMSMPKLAAHLFHEYMHNMGFNHPVPYDLGDIVKEIGEDLYG